MNNMSMDVDPLGTYEYPPYNYNHMQPHVNPNTQFQYDVKIEQTIPVAGFIDHYLESLQASGNGLTEQQRQLADLNNPFMNNEQKVQVPPTVNNSYGPDEDIKPLIDPKDIKKEKKIKRKSSYWSEKITDSDFKFYGCSVCNISFDKLHELDQHVTVHKDRITSYDLKIKNQIRRKMKKKELKRLRKNGKIKQEDNLLVEIKPEDGYIGNEKASDYNFNENTYENIGSKTNVDKDNDNKDSNIAYIDNNKGNGNTDENNDNKSNENINNVNKDSNISHDVKDKCNNKTRDENKVNKTLNDNEDSNKKIDKCGYVNNDKIRDENNSNESLNQKKDSNMNTDKINSDDRNDTNLENDSKAGIVPLPSSSSNDNESETKNNAPTELKNLEKIYKCFACQKQFTLSYYLKLHVRSHTDEKPYTCSICGQSFITASKLGRHNKRIHLDIRFQCRICYRYFTKFECLTKHFDKKHPDDKLEGEPYDYNAILPYLKELEEQLEKSKNETKPKTEDLWFDWPAPVEPPEPAAPAVMEQEMKSEPEQPLEILVEEIKVPIEIEIKREMDEEVKDELKDIDEMKEEDVMDDVFKDDDSPKEECLSDDNYFPTNTWVPTPKMEPDTVVAPRKRKKKKEGPLSCKICEKSISSQSYLRIHMRTHTGEKPFKCYLCNRGFITASKMHRHVLTHKESWEDDGVSVKEEKIKKETDEDGDENEEENSEKKKKERKAKIKMLKAKFGKKSKKDLDGRRLKRWEHTCEFCHRKFLHLETLQVHKKCHEGEERVHRCTFCLIEMEDDANLKEHEATHTGPKPYLCTICGKNYKRREAMVYHKKQHKPEKEFVCDVCSKSFNAPCKLQRHLASHTENKFVLRYECPVCAHMFNTKYHIQMHLASHQKEGLIQEENRNEILAMVLQNARKFPKHGDTLSNLTDVIPSDERSRICNICGEIFQHFYYLEEHLKSHGSKIAIDDINKVEEKKHVCQVCNKSFKLHYYLKLHSFTHTKEKPFTCQQCGKGFITKGKLKRHLETHTGLKKYQCHICCKFFTRTSYLRIHVRTIHGTQDYNFRMDKGYPLHAPLDIAMGHHSI